ncbi:VTT domain-containing protein [Parvibaculum sp.]|uniref:VTT domain-containing protein n=1 Tax=Parvibaculum sp. TaxID=2024848 RepID=UPI001B048C2F|nr:VTT domain-containing protein [Parvibaculum sp.]MBO6634912.1 VTT domain-containing protein [Parvibaculum sp.]MBO6678836.1 VTT domain-containing protein [Parvibaculum sp.]MBO6683754.1 VTT domain-containing protein [Parvibaculum sp.]MBO6903955.1 VTT domain-containing protein [Parvibaculum sp.]
MSAHDFSREEKSEKTGVLKPSRNVWRVEKAARARLLVDAAHYFETLRAAMRNARHSILVVGWDIDSRTRLVGPSGKVDDDLPETFGEFIAALARENPELEIKLLLWDYSVIYAMERELLPVVPLRWNTPRNIDLCLDDEIPVGASHHQKIVVIDDCLAFSGGLDITVRRWDTPAHDPANDLRVDPSDEPYKPFHDVQMMVDGDAAAALGELARRRWHRAACEELAPVPDAGDPWPEAVDPHFTGTTIGIARTEPAVNGGSAVREIETLFRDMIAAAERWIYIENQFLTCTEVARALAERLGENPDLEVLLVAPKTHEAWLEQQTMLAGRIRFMEIIRQAGVADRVRLVYPAVGREGGDVDVMVHSKVMIVDDALLRVGSANLCNRSMGTDTECDLVIEASDEASRAGVLDALGRLLGEHCGADPEKIVDVLRESGSIFTAMECGEASEHRLRPISDGGDPPGEAFTAIESIADPGRPIASGEHFADIVDLGGEESHSRFSTFVKVVTVVLFIVALGLLWRYTPLSEYAQPDKLRETFGGMADNPFAVIAIVALYVISGFFAFPVTVLILVTAGTFGLWPGLLYAALGSMSSALATYGAGRGLGARFLRNLIGPRINRISRGIGERGVLAIATIRLVPVAPFMLVNLVAGAFRIPVIDYTFGTFIGLAPGIVLLSVMGDRVFAMLEDPSLIDLAIVVGALALWIGFAFALQKLIARWRKSD